MKRTVFGLCALMMCFVFTSCDKLGIGGGDPVKTIEDLQEKIENEGDDFTKDDWESFGDEFMDAIEKFANSDPSEEEYEEMEDAVKELMEAIYKVDKKSLKIGDKVMTKLTKSKRYKDVEKKMKKIRKKFKSDGGSSDDDEDYDDED